MYTKYLYFIIDEGSYFSSDGDRVVELRDLISHRKVWIEVTLTIEYTLFHDLTPHRMTCSYCEIYDSLRKSRKHTGESHTDRADIHIWLGGELDRIRTTTEHFGV